MKHLLFILVAICMLSISSCEVLKPYQMIALEQEDMRLESAPISKNESNFQSYREGASGGNGGKVGGGCGCN